MSRARISPGLPCPRETADGANAIAKRRTYHSTYMRLWRQQNVQQSNATAARWRVKPEAVRHRRIYTRQRLHRLRAQALAAYGGVCACCGEGERRFLTIDHIDGGGNQHRKAMKRASIWEFLKTHQYPAGYQVLCFNCNCGRQYNNGICPHQVSFDCD